MATFRSLYPRIRLMCPNVPEMVMTQALKDAVRRLCTNGWSYRLKLDDIAVTAGTAEYTITMPADEEVVACVDAYWVDGDYKRGIKAESEEFLDKKYPSWRLSEGSPMAFTVETIGKVRLAPIPSMNGTLHQLRVIRRPAMSMTALPDYVVDNWADQLVMGAQSMILMIPKKAWSNATIGYRLHKDFDASIARIRRTQRTGNTNATLTMRIPSIT